MEDEDVIAVHEQGGAVSAMFADADRHLGEALRKTGTG
jgi:hypothetical protein